MQTTVIPICTNTWYTYPHFRRTAGPEITERDARPSSTRTFVPSHNRTHVDGDKAEPMPSTPMLAVPYIALARGVLLNTAS